MCRIAKRLSGRCARGCNQHGEPRRRRSRAALYTPASGFDYAPREGTSGVSANSFAGGGETSGGIPARSRRVVVTGYQYETRGGARRFRSNDRVEFGGDNEHNFDGGAKIVRGTRLFRWRLGFVWLVIALFVRLSLGQFYVPNVLLVLQAEHANLIRFGGAHVANPHDTKFLLAP